MPHVGKVGTACAVLQVMYSVIQGKTKKNEVASCPGNTQTHTQLQKRAHRKSGGEGGTLQLAAGSWQQTLPQRRAASLALVIDHINDEDTFFIWPTAFFFYDAFRYHNHGRAATAAPPEDKSQ